MPCSSSSARKLSACSLLRLYPAATEAPWLARLRQMAAPMPRLPPVTRATRPLSLPSGAWRLVAMGALSVVVVRLLLSSLAGSLGQPAGEVRPDVLARP